MNVHNPRPNAHPPKFDAIAAELTKLQQWVPWRYEQPEHPGQKWPKVPYRINGRRASTTNASHWSSFDEVKKAYEKGGFDGIGFVFDGKVGPDGLCYVGIDFDDCFEPGATGRGVKQSVKALVKQLGSYLK